MNLMIKNRKTTFLIINIFVPIFIGAIIYYFISPNVIFVKIADSIWERKNIFDVLEMKNPLLEFIRNYLLDMLWGYALVFALYFVIGDNSAVLNKILMIAFVFSAVMELGQISNFVSGTFDLFDIVLEFLSEAIAVFIINNKKISHEL